MIRLASLFWLAAAAVVALGLYYVSYEVDRLEAELYATNQRLAQQREAIDVLGAEWSYLSQPGRVRELAQRYLGLEPLTAAQIIGFQDLPGRNGLRPGSVDAINSQEIENNQSALALVGRN